MTGLLTLARALAVGYWRDRLALFFSILFPLVFLVIIGGLFGGDTTPRFPVVVVGEVEVFDGLPPQTRAQVDQVLRISHSPDLAEALEQVRRGDQSAAIVQQGSEVVVHYSAGDPTAVGAVRGVVDALVQGANLAAAGQPPRYTVAAEPVEDESLQPIQYLTPGILGWAIAAAASFAAAVTLVSWRQNGLLRRLSLSPVGVPAVVGARVLVSLGIALVQTVVFVGVAAGLFGLRLADSWWLAIPLVLAGTLAFLSIGLLAGAMVKTVETANIVTNVLVIPMAFLSGSFFPLSLAPEWLRTCSLVLPLRHLNDAMQDVLARGVGVASVLPQLLALLGFAVVCSAIAVWRFRWEDA
ncbi:MAG TPA: ABC transporter permease [Natronosporangium sp.]